MSAGDLRAISHHHRQRGNRFEGQVEEVREAVVDKIVGAATVHEDHHSMALNGGRDAKGRRCGLARECMEA